MTSGAILPSTGATPPEFQRSAIPAHLRPKGPDAAVQAVPEQASVVPPPVRAPVEFPQSPTGQQGDPSDQPPRNSGEQLAKAANLGGASAVVVQIQEARDVTAPSRAVPKNADSLEQNGLTDEELSAVSRLKGRDREVRAHEAAHATAGAGYTGAPSYEFVTGPDGVRYAVGGHVDIDVSEVSGDPKATIAKLEVVRRAALAPARPSGQDRAVAAAASAKSQQAQAELTEQAREESIARTTGNETEGSSGLSQPLEQLSDKASADSEEGGSSGFPSFSQAFPGGFVSQEPETINIDLIV
ncbi:MAG: hypothetical protein JKY57_00965 [Kordiimonadaceae bacterium]|nr:hypothetical protein [Kordiimonadaceae bacterium]